MEQAARIFHLTQWLSRYTRPQAGVSSRNRRAAAALGGEMSNCPAKPEIRERGPVANTIFDSVAQSVEQLPFKPWVRGSSPRWVTSSSQASYRLRRAFLFHCKAHCALIEAAPRFQLRPAAMGSQLGVAAAQQFCFAPGPDLFYQHRIQKGHDHGSCPPFGFWGYISPKLGMAGLNFQ